MSRFGMALKCVLAVAVLSLTLSQKGWSQEVRGSISGTVLDQSGAAVIHAHIDAVQVETGFTRGTNTDAQGHYLLVLLPLGHYRLEATAPGFQKYVQAGITISVDQAAKVPIHLEVGATTQTINVQSDAVLLQTTSDLGDTVHEREMLDLPLNGRDFSQLGLLQPGVAPLTQGLQEAGGSLRANQGYAVNGMRPESNEFLIDGSENFNNVDGGFVLRPPIDAISEFRILTNTASAEFGHSAGSSTNIVTRSG